MGEGHQKSYSMLQICLLIRDTDLHREMRHSGINYRDDPCERSLLNVSYFSQGGIKGVGQNTVGLMPSHKIGQDGKTKYG